MVDEVRSVICAARASINDATARRDAAAIGAFFMPSYHVVTARSMQRNGREDSVRSWADAFARDRNVTHIGIPDEIHVNEEWGMAEEHGHWTGMLIANDGPIGLAGVYAAKWQYSADGWLLQAEIFTPITITRGSRSD
jgi:ketosteroid isomerase-like protein